jgi:zinc protease
VKRIAFAFVLLGAALAWSTPASAALKATQYTLKNGMEVVVIPDHRAPVVTHMLWYRVGGVDDPMGHSGLAHFFEHMMFKGTRRVPGNELTLTVARNGGQSNAFTSHDYTAYYERIAKDRLPLMMELEADRMRNLILNDEGVKTERDVVLEERRLRIESDPSSIMGEQLQAALYLSHPYGRPVIGWGGEVARIGRAEAQAYYDRHYAPNNAILIVAGDVEPDEVLRLAERTYGRVSRRELEPRAEPVVPPRLGEARIAFSHPDARLPTLMRAYRVPSYVTDARAAEALEVLAEYLGGGPTSRLYRILVIDRKLAVGAGAYYSGVSRGPSEFSVYAYPAPGVSFDQVEAAIDAIIRDAGTKAPLPQAFERAKTVLVADAIYSRDSQDAMANDYGAALVVGLTTKDVEEWPDRIKAVSAARMQEAARRYLIKSESATGRLSPQPAAVPATAGASPAEGAP